MIYPVPTKKILSYGKEPRTAAKLREYWPRLQQLPFDGLIIRLSPEAGGGNIFDVRQWANVTKPAQQAEIEALGALPQSEVLRHSFLIVYGTSTMDWFSDEDWQKAEENLRFCARAARSVNLAGICYDGEPYGDTLPWQYAAQPQRNRYSFREYYDQVRKRGAQFIKAVQEEFPGAPVMSFRLLSDFQNGSPFSQKLFAELDATRAAQKLEQAWWGLHAAFINGMLDAVAPAVTLHDGNEEAYYYTSTHEYFHLAQALRGAALKLVAPENRQKYLAQYRLSCAVSVDYCSGSYALLNSFPKHLSGQALALNDKQRAQWFEHNVYCALATADEYVWVFNEEANWWTGRAVPPGFTDAIRAAKRKYEAGQPLGFAVDAMLARARERIRREEQIPIAGVAQKS